MKKLIGSLLVTVSVAVCAAAFTACDTKGEENVYDRLTRLSQTEYPSLKLEVSVTNGGDTLKGVYDAISQGDSINVEYSYQVMNTIEKVDGEYVVPSEKISTKTGIVKLKDGSVTEQIGDGIDISLKALTAGGLSFKQEYFTNILDTEGFFSAEVKSASSFLGYLITATNMKVEAHYSSEALQTVGITYTDANSAAVTLNYSFN